MMVNLNPSENDLLRALVQHGVQFVVVGGRAVNFHGHLRAAPDLDLFYSKTGDNPLRLIDALRPFGGTALTLDSLAATVVQVNIHGSPIQLHPEIDGVSFDETYANAVFIQYAGVRLPFISCPHLLQSKRASGRKPDRQKDLDDVAALQTLCVE